MKLDLETLRLRRLAISDAPVIRAALVDGRVARTISRMPHPYPEGAEFSYIEGKNQTAWGVVGYVRGVERFIGMARYTAPRFTTVGDIEFGYWVDPQFWGQGVGTGVILLLLEKAAREKVGVVVARTLDENEASKRIFRKLGFEVFAKGQHYCLSRDVELPDIYWKKVLDA